MKYKLIINEEIYSKYDQSETWIKILSAFKDSSNVPEWPRNELIKTDAVKEGGEVEVQYRILGGEYKFKYQIKKLSDFEIIYCPKGDHPLDGDILLRVAKDRNQSRIIWKGNYQTNSFLAKLGFIIFTRKFFKDIKQNLKNS